jgi:ABC-type multidrug transport system ATPase subunit
MKQRVKLAMAFHVQADILFLDEPGTNLDSQSLAWYTDQLRNVPPTTIVFIASNQPQEYPSNAQKIDILRFK